MTKEEELLRRMVEVGGAEDGGLGELAGMLSAAGQRVLELERMQSMLEGRVSRLLSERAQLKQANAGLQRLLDAGCADQLAKTARLELALQRARARIDGQDRQNAALRAEINTLRGAASEGGCIGR